MSRSTKINGLLFTRSVLKKKSCDLFRLLTIVRDGTPDKGMIITDQLRYIDYITYTSTK